MINPENTQKNAQINPNPKPINHNPQPTMPIHHLTHDTPIGANHTHIKTNPSNPSEQTAIRERKGRRRKRERRGGQLRLERVGVRVNKICIYVLEYCYSTILTLELYCSTIAKKFAIVE